MSSPPRLSRTLLLLAAPVLLVVGVWLGGHPQHLPRFARDVFVANHDTRVVDEAIDRIASDYYRPIKKDSLASASIAGAVASLGDRFSHYLTPHEYRAFNQPPSFTGIGVAVDPDQRGLLIARVFDSSPAARASLQPGDVIVAVNGRSLAGLSPATAAGLIKGPPGTDVRLAARGRSQPSQLLAAAGHAIAPSVPVVVLVDHNTASAAEIVAAALQDHHRATIVGTHTFGKGVFQEEEPLSNGGALDITVGEYFTPAGRNLGSGGLRQGAGVVPEVPVRDGVDSARGLAVALGTLAAKAR